MTKIVLPLLTLLTLSQSLMSDTNTTEEFKDMSDPLAIYTRGSIGITNRGINIKMDIQYDSGNENKSSKHVLEIKGFAGEAIGWDGPYERSNSVDSLRYRNLNRNKVNGRGTQIDLTYDLHSDTGALSYSMMQALPTWKNFTLYPLAGLGVSFGKDVLQDDGTIQSGFSVPGVFAVAGMYGKYTVNDNIWINYNPFWYVSLAGSDLYMDYGFEGGSSVLTHEATLSYKLTPRSNIRYYAN